MPPISGFHDSIMDSSSEFASVLPDDSLLGCLVGASEAAVG